MGACKKCAKQTKQTQRINHELTQQIKENTDLMKRQSLEIERLCADKKELQNEIEKLTHWVQLYQRKTGNASSSSVNRKKRKKAMHSHNRSKSSILIVEPTRNPQQSPERNNETQVSSPISGGPISSTRILAPIAEHAEHMKMSAELMFLSPVSSQPSSAATSPRSQSVPHASIKSSDNNQDISNEWVDCFAQSMTADTPNNNNILGDEEIMVYGQPRETTNVRCPSRSVSYMSDNSHMEMDLRYVESRRATVSIDGDEPSPAELPNFAYVTSDDAITADCDVVVRAPFRLQIQ